MGQRFPAAVIIANSSVGSAASGSILLGNVMLVPACANPTDPTCAGAVDPGVFLVGSTGTGRAGGSCAGTTFAISQSSPGVYSFTPSAPIVLPPVVALSTNVAPTASSLTLLLFLVLVSVGLTRRKVA